MNMQDGIGRMVGRAGMGLGLFCLILLLPGCIAGTECVADQKPWFARHSDPNIAQAIIELKPVDEKVLLKLSHELGYFNRDLQFILISNPNFPQKERTDAIARGEYWYFHLVLDRTIPDRRYFSANGTVLPTREDWVAAFSRIDRDRDCENGLLELALETPGLPPWVYQSAWVAYKKYQLCESWNPGWGLGVVWLSSHVSARLIDILRDNIVAFTRNESLPSTIREDMLSLVGGAGGERSSRSASNEN